MKIGNNLYKGLQKGWFKDKTIIGHCVVCGVMFKRKAGVSGRYAGRCYPHRKEYFRKISKEYYANLTPEQKVKVYQKWLLWVKNNLDRRRAIALRSFFKKKEMLLSVDPVLARILGKIKNQKSYEARKTKFKTQV